MKIDFRKKRRVKFDGTILASRQKSFTNNECALYCIFWGST